MPIYELHCGKCGGDFELQRPVARMPKTAKCPSCGGRARRKLSMFAVMRGAEPDFAAGEGDAGDMGMGGMDDDFGGMGGMDDDSDF